MATTILQVPRPEKRRFVRLVRKTRDAIVHLRCRVLLAMTKCAAVARAAVEASVARSTAYQTLWRYEEGGLDAIATVEAGRQPYKVGERELETLERLIQRSPQDFGWARSRWSSELLAKQLEVDTGTRVHASYIRRLLPLLDVVYRRPGLFIRRVDPRKNYKLRVVRRLLANLPANEVALYEDEVDINLLPKMGSEWTFRGQQPQVGTPGKNEKRYIAGAWNPETGQVHWVEAARKNTELFVKLLQQLVEAYPKARRIHLIVDNWICHKCKKLAKLLRKYGLNEKIHFVYLPTYSPKYNPIERLWKCLHDTVTRNHKHKTVDALMEAVRAFIRAASPWPGAGHATARLPEPIHV
jgi:putative transposase